MARIISEQYRDELQKKVKDQITEYMEAKDILGNLFGGKRVSDNVIQKLLFQHFDKLAESNLSGRLWDPAKSKLAASNYAHFRYSSGITSRMSYEDWSVLEKQDIIAVGLERIGKKPMKQMNHYFFTGEQLLTNGTRAPSPNPSQYNYCLDPSTSNGTLERPLAVVETGVAWNTAANIRANIENAINGYMEVNPEAIASRLVVFYPSVARSIIFKKYSTSGDGFVSGASIFAENGIMPSKIISLAPIYLPTGASASLVAPTTANFDIYILDQDQIDMYYTDGPVVNVWFDKLNSLYPEMVIEANVAGLPFFKPITGEQSSDKIYKGVVKIDGISAS